MTYSEIAKERDELKSENETLRAIMDRIVEKGNKLKATNKELRHHAEVAERALQLLGEEYYNEFDLDDCEYTPKNIEEFIKRYIVKAEKELEEGR